MYIFMQSTKSDLCATDRKAAKTPPDCWSWFNRLPWQLSVLFFQLESAQRTEKYQITDQILSH